MLVGSIALLWIAIKLLAPQNHDKEDTPEATSDLWRAVRLVVIADIVMSLDNVVAVAAIAQGGYLLLIIGLAVSIPMVIAGSAIIMALLERFPILVWGGAGILGWVAGEIFSGDPVVQGFFHGMGIENFEVPAEIVGCLIVLVTGYIWRRQHHVSLEEA
jgi:YjbE family integral membrane protein